MNRQPFLSCLCSYPSSCSQQTSPNSRRVLVIVIINFQRGILTLVHSITHVRKIRQLAWSEEGLGTPRLAVTALHHCVIQGRP